jgi:hypothetical protein
MMNEPKTAISPEMEILKTKLKATWMREISGRSLRRMRRRADLLSGSIYSGREGFGRRLRTGNLSIPAACAGAIVTGVDIVESGRAGAQKCGRQGLNCQFDGGRCRSLPYADGVFDVVVNDVWSDVCAAAGQGRRRIGPRLPLGRADCDGELDPGRLYRKDV